MKKVIKRIKKQYKSGEVFMEDKAEVCNSGRWC